MAFVEITWVEGMDVPFFCNVHAGVGKSQPNQRNDVLLVQYLLKAVFSPPAILVPPLSPPPGPPLPLSGNADAATLNHILHFQAHLKSQGCKISVDGKVNRAQGFFGALTGNQYTITHLNNAFAKARPATGRCVWMAPDCPKALRDALIAESKPKPARVITIQEGHGGGV